MDGIRRRIISLHALTRDELLQNFLDRSFKGSVKAIRNDEDIYVQFTCQLFDGEACELEVDPWLEQDLNTISFPSAMQHDTLLGILCGRAMSSYSN